MKKITILALHLGYGGIERCISNLVNSLCDDYDIEIVSTYKILDKPAFKIDSKVNIKYLITDMKPNKKEIKESLKKLKLITFMKELRNAQKILKLKKELMINYIKNCHSDIIISTRDIHNLWLSKYGNDNCLKIGWEHNFHNNNQKYINKIIKSVYGLDYFVLVSKSLKEFYDSKTGNCKCVYIPNSISYIPKNKAKLTGKNLISVGRLEVEKGYSDLIDVFSLVHKVYPDWKLNIMGDGSLKEELQRKIHKLNLTDSIILHGFRDSKYIEKELLKSSIYLMSSTTESFGLVLIEASSFGLPCIAFTSASGACEIIKDNWDGYLIENRDKEKMAKRIINLIKNPERRIIMGDNAYKKSISYISDNIKGNWIKLFEEK